MDQNHKPSFAGADTRRNFIKKAATAAAVVAATNSFKTPVYGQSSAPSAGRVIGANDRIAVGYIGIGGPPSLTDCPAMGLAHVNSQKSHAAENNIAQAAVCDLYKTRSEHARKEIGTSDVVAYDDYRKLLERKDIDAVLIATHDPAQHPKRSIGTCGSARFTRRFPLIRIISSAGASFIRTAPVCWATWCRIGCSP